MCGIAGVVATRTLTATERESADLLVKLLRHRGPDGEGVFHADQSAWIQTRLSLVGKPHPLPMRSSDDLLVLVFNGEIYNFKALRNQLSEYGPFDTGSDTEVVLAAWKKWGKSMLHYLDGMYAFVIWDEKEGSAFAARDPLGIKPFFFAHDLERFVFSSEAGTLIESGLISFRPRDEAIAEFLTAPYFSGARSTPFQDIEPLLPGHFLEWKDGKIHTEAFFKFDQPLCSEPPSRKKIEEFSESLTHAVKSQATSDFEIGSFLSGGLDSTLISVIAQDDAPPLRAWTIHYPENEKANYETSMIVKSHDTPHATDVAKRYGMNLEQIQVNDALFESAFLQALNTNDLICAWEQEVSQVILARGASRDVKAVLVGDAADETHYGYSFLLNPEVSRRPEKILKFFGTIPMRASFLKDPIATFGKIFEEHSVASGYQWNTEASGIQATSKLISDFWLSRLLHNGDLHTMHSSLEARVPFGDRALLNIAQTIGQNVGYHQRTEKWHLREASRAHLPREFAYRKKSALPKNLNARAMIQKHFRLAWSEHGGLIDAYVDADVMNSWCDEVPTNEKETSLRFRVLALIHWMRRFSA